MKIVTADEMKKIDEYAQKILGIPSIVLMENAGRGAAQVALLMLAKKRNKNVVCVCGKGNNGGDGFVCTRHLINNGINVKIFLFGDPCELKNDPQINCNILQNMGLTVRNINNKENFSYFIKTLKNADLVIDAIFGIGLNDVIREPYRNIIDCINKSKKDVLAIDVPSGLDATTGKVLGTCIKAKRTATFAFLKTGFHPPLPSNLLSKKNKCERSVFLRSHAGKATAKQNRASERFYLQNMEKAIGYASSRLHKNKSLLYTGKVEVVDISIPEKIAFKERKGL